MQASYQCDRSDEGGKTNHSKSYITHKENILRRMDYITGRLTSRLNARILPYKKKCMSTTKRGVFCHQRVTNFGADILEKGTTPILKISKLTDVVKQIVYIGVIDPAVTVILAHFVTHYENLSKN